MIRIPLIILALSLLGITTSLSQNPQDLEDAADRYCSFDEMQEQWLSKNAQHLSEIEAANQELERLTRDFAESEFDGRSNNYIIPVVFHVIHAEGPENISDEQIHDAIRVMTEDFTLENSDITAVIPEFESIVADVGVEFRLAKLDPNGDCTNGIVRVFSNATYEGGENLKEISPAWPRANYMNVWVAANLSSGAAGYTYTPGSVSGFWGAAADGIVIKHNYVGSIGTGSPTLSRALTHEVGHWINLRHPWGGSNNPGLDSNCDSDDNVADTPNTIGWTQCNLNGHSCGSLDNVQNFMEYSYCSRMFTQGQRTRMLAALNSGTASRSNLHASSNLIQTGVLQEGEICKAEFVTNTRRICAGDSVVFTDHSYHGVTSREWTFEGGTPSSSSEEEVVVYYNEPGVYNVSLQISNGSDVVSETFNNHIDVWTGVGPALPYAENFEGNVDIDNDWHVIDAGTSTTWQISNNVSGASGNSALRLPNRYLSEGDVSQILSYPIDLSNTNTDVEITFKYAYAKRNSSNSERFTFWVSSNCGETWSLRGIWNNNFDTAPMTNINWAPSSSSHWETVTIDNLSETHLVSNFMFKFEFESDGGNNFYIDDINIQGPVVSSIEEKDISDQISVFPNPATDEVNLMISGEQGYRFDLVLLNTLGQPVMSKGQQVFNGGTDQYTLNTANLSAGVYFMSIETSTGERAVKRLLVVR